MPGFVAYRACAWTSPFWQDPSPQEGRFNRPGEAPTTYLGLHPLTPWAELLRATDRRTLDEVRHLRPVTWAARVIVDDTDLVELTFDNCDAYGLVPEDLVGEKYGATQALASSLRANPANPKAILAPSAALPGTRSLILLGPRIIAPYDLEPNYDPDLDTSVAATAALGSSLAGLVASVYYKHTATVHPGLDAWNNGDEYEFTEPAVTGDEFAIA